MKGTLKDIINIIAESEKMLKMEEGWDGEDAVVIQRKTWEKTTDTLMNFSIRISVIGYDENIPLPEINPCRDGSIDIAYDGEEEYTKLLMNFKEGKDIFSFYGRKDKPGTEEVNGHLKVEKISKWFCEWMMENL